MNYAPTSSIPEAATHFAQLQNDEWGHLYPAATVDRSQFDLLNNRYDEWDITTLRLAWFACNEEGEPLGVAMLVGDGEVEPRDERDLEGPWFAGLKALVLPYWTSLPNRPDYSAFSDCDLSPSTRPSFTNSADGPLNE